MILRPNASLAGTWDRCCLGFLRYYVRDNPSAHAEDSGIDLKGEIGPLGDGYIVVVIDENVLRISSRDGKGR
jgi:hypothetical protein